jgi:zinc transporter 2
MTSAHKGGNIDSTVSSAQKYD